MAEDLGKLSPEQVKKLAGVISDAKSLTKQQADIIEQVLAGELEIGKLRIANLQEYFDIYSRNLDIIARKHSALNDAFLVLNHKLMESYSKAVSGNLEASSKRGKPSTKNEQSNSGGSNGSGGNPPSGSGTPPTGKSKDSEVSSKISDDKLTALETFT